jgi:rhodanese-related sulfurtransferase
MGPFVPELISDQLNLIVALVLGIAFGAVLEQAGFSSSRRLAGLFYGYDFTVLRVFFTAAITAMSGVLLLGYFGLLDTDAIFVNPTWLVPAIVGGIIMGGGFILGGYCPGTSVCAAAIGKIDAMFFIGGGLLGVFAFGEFFPLYGAFYESSSLGPLKVFDSLGISQGWFAFLLILMAVGAFAATTWIEKKVNRTAAPSLDFSRRKHVVAALAIIALGALFVILPDRKTSLLTKVVDPHYVATHHVQMMNADELAFRIVDHEPNIRIIDLRPADTTGRGVLPGGENIAMKELFGKEWIPLFSPRHIKKVLVGATEEQERTAFLLLQELGYENLAVLQGGFEAFDRTILTPGAFVPTGSRWDGDVREFRVKARADILRMIAESKNTGAQPQKKTKKVQGGC